MLRYASLVVAFAWCAAPTRAFVPECEVVLDSNVLVYECDSSSTDSTDSSSRIVNDQPCTLRGEITAVPGGELPGLSFDVDFERFHSRVVTWNEVEALEVTPEKRSTAAAMGMSWDPSRNRWFPGTPWGSPNRNANYADEDAVRLTFGVPLERFNTAVRATVTVSSELGEGSCILCDGERLNLTAPFNEVTCELPFPITWEQRADAYKEKSLSHTGDERPSRGEESTADDFVVPPAVTPAPTFAAPRWLATSAVLVQSEVEKVFFFLDFADPCEPNSEDGSSVSVELVDGALDNDKFTVVYVERKVFEFISHVCGDYLAVCRAAEDALEDLGERDGGWFLFYDDSDVVESVIELAICILVDIENFLSCFNPEYREGVIDIELPNFPDFERPSVQLGEDGVYNVLLNVTSECGGAAELEACLNVTNVNEKPYLIYKHDVVTTCGAQGAEVMHLGDGTFFDDMEVERPFTNYRECAPYSTPFDIASDGKVTMAEATTYCTDTSNKHRLYAMVDDAHGLSSDCHYIDVVFNHAGSCSSASCLPPADDGGDEICLAASAHVLATSTLVELPREVAVGGVRAGDWLATGEGERFSDVLLNFHSQITSEAPVLEVHVAGAARPLALTSKHMVRRANGEFAGADELRVGDLVAREGGVAGVVTKIATAPSTAIVAPLTRAGTVLVEGTVASCFSSNDATGVTSQSATRTHEAAVAYAVPIFAPLHDLVPSAWHTSAAYATVLDVIGSVSLPVIRVFDAALASA